MMKSHHYISFHFNTYLLACLPAYLPTYLLTCFILSSFLPFFLACWLAYSCLSFFFACLSANRAYLPACLRTYLTYLPP